MIAHEDMSRRAFLRGLLGAGGLVLGVQLLGPTVVLADGEEGDEGEASWAPSAWLAIAPDGAVTIWAHRSEMGTGIRTSLPMVVAEELEADWERVEIVQAPGDEATYGSQNTDGSRSVRKFFQVMRVAGATARTMLEQAAALTWGVQVAECKAQNHLVVHVPSGRTLAFGALVENAKHIPVPQPETLTYKPREAYRYVGKPVPITDLRAIVDGSAVFGMDASVPGMKLAAIARCPVLGGGPKSVDSKAAEALPGVEGVVTLAPFSPPHGFQALGGVAVIASNTWAALKGRDLLEIEWELGDNASYDSSAFRETLLETAAKPGAVIREHGDVATAMKTAATVHTADYYVPHLAHASMEPPCAVATTTADACEVWAPTQHPQAARDTLAQVLKLPVEQVTVHVTLLGGGFGRKSKPDYIVEAALLSREVGAPVKVVWSREDDIRHDYFHTVAAVRMQAGLDKGGQPNAWLQRTVFPTIFSTFAAGANQGSPMELGMGFTDVPYDVPNLRCEVGQADAHVRIGWLRSVAHIYHAFAISSFVDELAHLAGKDPRGYHQQLLGADRHIALGEGVAYDNHSEPLEKYPIDTARLRAVTDLVAEKAGWGRDLPAGHGLGIAAHRSFLSYVAVVAEVAVDDAGALTIPRVDIALDCGLVVNPDRVRAQMEGCVVFGTSLALMGEITASEGRIRQSNFHDYPVARIHDAPREIHVHLLESDAPPAGVGEPGVPPVAPALTNAIFAATGKRIRRLPIDQHDLRG
jgi:isoquinoline 1-oxidoreductase beta subunit